MKFFYNATPFALGLILLSLPLSGCSMYLKQFALYQLEIKAEKAIEENQYDMAVKYYKQAHELKLDNKKIKKSFEDAKHAAAKFHYQNALTIFDEGKENLHIVRKAIDEIGTAIQYRPIAEYRNFGESLLRRSDELENELHNLVLDASQFEIEHEYIKSLDALQTAVKIDPYDEKTLKRKQAVEDAGVSYYLEVAVMHADTEKYQQAADAIGNAMHIRPSEKLEQQLRTFQRRVKAQTIYKNIEIHIRKKQYYKIRHQLKQMVSLHPENKAYRHLLGTALREYSQTLLKNNKKEAAYDCFLELMHVENSYKGLRQAFKTLKKDLSMKYISKAQDYAEMKLPGNAYLMTTYMDDHGMDTADSRALQKKVSQILKSKATVDVEIQPFHGNTFKNRGVGMSVSDILVDRLLSRKSNRYQVMIPDKQVTSKKMPQEKILPPQKMSPKKDNLLLDLGKINLQLSGRVDSFSTSYRKSVEPRVEKYISHYTKRPNPEYAKYQEEKKGWMEKDSDKNFLASLAAEVVVDVLFAPSEYIKDPVYAYYSYNIEHYMISGEIKLTFYIMKSNTKEILLKKTIVKDFFKVDSYVPGNRAAGVEHDPLEAPDEQELQSSLMADAANASESIIFDYLQETPSYYAAMSDLALELDKRDVANEYGVQAFILDHDKIRIANHLYTDRHNHIGCKIEEEDGVPVVTSVLPNGAADSAGIEAGDEITSFCGKPITSKKQIAYAMQVFRPGTICPISLKRNGKTIKRCVILKAIEYSGCQNNIPIAGRACRDARLCVSAFRIYSIGTDL